MSIASFKPDAELSSDGVDDMLEQAVWLVRMREGLRNANAAVADEVAKMIAAHRVAKVQRDQQPARQPRATDPDYLNGDYEMVGTKISYEFGE